MLKFDIVIVVYICAQGCVWMHIGDQYASIFIAGPTQGPTENIHIYINIYIYIYILYIYIYRERERDRDMRVFFRDFLKDIFLEVQNETCS